MRVLVQAEPIDPAALVAELASGAAETGAVVTFTGLVRGGDGQVEALELHAYPGFTERQIEAQARAVSRQHELLDLVVAHRIGRMSPGEPIVFVAAAAGHRRAAFLAVDQMMDYLKTSAPFWKAEHGPAGSRWIEPRAEDHADAARWAGD